MRFNLIFENKTDFNSPSKKIFEKIGKQVLKIFGQKKAQLSVSLFLVDENEIQNINKECRGIDKPTDVISFRLVENPKNLPLTKKSFPLEFDLATKTIYFGEIFVCTSVALLQAKDYMHSQTREIFELFVHGMLHLLGCDHHEEEETKIMKDFEEQMIWFLNQKNFEKDFDSDTHDCEISAKYSGEKLQTENDEKN